MTTDNLAACREAFEKWMRTYYPNVFKPEDLQARREGNGYSHHVMDCQWVAFQAAYSARPAPAITDALVMSVAEGIAMVLHPHAESIDDLSRGDFNDIKDAAKAALTAALPHAVDATKERCDGQRVIEWLDNPNRQRANLAFTDGLERQIAYRFEAIRAAAIRREVVEECAKLCDAYANKQQGRMEAEGTCYSLHMQRRDTAFRLAQQLRALKNPTATAGKEKQNG